MGEPQPDLDPLRKAKEPAEGERNVTRMAKGMPQCDMAMSPANTKLAQLSDLDYPLS